jgi:hypothetical protein
VLRTEVEQARLVDHVGQVAWMARGKAVVAPRFDGVELVVGIAVGQPRGPRLVGAEQLPRRVEGEPVGEADPGAHRLPGGEVGGEALDRAALAARIVGAAAVGARVTPRRQRHSHHRRDRRAAEVLARRVLEAVAVGVAEEEDTAVVGPGHEDAVVAVAEAVDVGEFEGQGIDREAREEESRRLDRDALERLAAT